MVLEYDTIAMRLCQKVQTISTFKTISFEHLWPYY